MLFTDQLQHPDSNIRNISPLSLYTALNINHTQHSLFIATGLPAVIIQVHVRITRTEGCYKYASEISYN